MFSDQIPLHLTLKQEGRAKEPLHFDLLSGVMEHASIDRKAASLGS